MSRNTGTFNFAANFEVLAKAPLDAKQLVGVKADLTGATTWNGSGDIWLFDGAIVSVSSDPDPLNNGIYFLKDADNYDNIDNWVKVGEGTGTITGGTNGLGTDGANIVLGGELLSGTTITIVTGTSLIIEDLRSTTLGLQYADDYSLAFDDRSLVDKAYVDAVATGLQPKTAVWVATTSGITLSGTPQTIDGVIVTDGQRVLVKDQGNPIDNGIYVATGGTWQRSPDFDGNPQGEITQGALIPVISGVTLYNTLWVLTTPDPITGGTTPLNFTYFSRPTSLIAGLGINISGVTINVDGGTLTGNSIIWSGDTFNVDVTSGTLATALASKLDISVFSGYTGTTEIRLTGIEDDIDYLSGVTENKLDLSIFTGYTASTEIRLTGIEDDIDYISGQTLTISIFTGYTASTEIRLTGIEDDVQYISGITDNKLDTSIFTNYTGTTQPILDAALTGATNGLDFLGREVILGGDLIQNTTINLSTFDLKFSGDSLQYSADYSAGYNARSIPDVDYVTGYTQSAITSNSNVLNIADVTGTTYTATTTSDFIGASGGTTIYLPNPPKDGQRIVVADIGGNALTLPITIDGNGKEIVGSTSGTINTDYGSITFIYNTKGFWSTAAFIN